MVNKNTMPPLELQPQTITSIKKTIEHLVVFVGGFFIVIGIILGGSYFMTPNKTTGPCTGSVAQAPKEVDPNLQTNKPTKRWRLNDNGVSQRYIYLSSTGRENRMKELLSHYDNAPDYEVRKVVARIYQVYPEVLICIAYADTSLGNYLKTPNNVGNVGNNDRGDTRSMRTAEQGVAAIGQTLNNQRLGDYNTVNQLSRYGNPDGKIYASSTVNRHNNVTNCIGLIRNKGIPDNFAFRW